MTEDCTEATLKFTTHEFDLLTLAVWRFMNAAYDRHGFFSQKGFDERADDMVKKAAALWKDAKEAEAVLAKLQRCRAAARSIQEAR